MSTKAELELHSALLSTGQVQPVDAQSKGGSISILSRQVPGQEKAWLETLARLLLAAEANEISVHLCRRYILKNGQMVFGWHIEVTSKNAKALKDDLEPLLEVLKAARPSLNEAPPVQQPAPAPVQQAPRRNSYQGRGNAGTTAHPRPPNEPGGGTAAPAGFVPQVVVVRDDVDDDGKRHIEEEYPLPHVHRELNRMNQKGRGARKTAAR